MEMGILTGTATDRRLLFLEGAVTAMRERLDALERARVADHVTLALHLRRLADALDGRVTDDSVATTS